ncbi:MAG: hypothetical protein JSS70_05780 [Bacteroidetes bacterium]|nr:hypothetical protein [Bacteroidota bacterium]
MRKALMATAILLAVCFASPYLFIPSTIHISQVQYLSIPANAVVRSFNNFQNCSRWMPSAGNCDGKTIEYNEIQFLLAKLYETALQKIAIITSSSDTVNSLISSNQLSKDSSFIYWECSLTAGISPISRIQQYNKAKKIKISIDSILGSFARFTSSGENIYGYPIIRTKVKDSILISEKKILPSYPTTSQVYELISSLKKYISDQQGDETGFPMLNIMKTDSTYDMMAAIPIRKIIPEKGNKKIKRVLYNGNLLMTEVKGGISAINKAFVEMENYKEDYDLQSPAIPYQLLITDRTKITDTSEWKTQVYYPFY